MRKGTPIRQRVRGSADFDPTTTTSMTYVEYLRQSLTQLEQAVQHASEAGSWQAVGSLKLTAMRTRAKLNEEIAKSSSPDDSMSDEQLLGVIVEAVASLPPQHLERIEDAISLRRTGKVVRLVQG